MSKFRNKQLFNMADAASKHRVKMAILRIFIVIIVVLFLSAFIALSLYSKHSSFTVSIAKTPSETQYSLVLSEHGSFAEESAHLRAMQIPDITNIEAKDIPNDVDKIDGQHNGENYFAYTFYLKNNGEATCTYQYTIKIVEATKQADKIIRVRVYQNGKAKTYARTKTDGSGAERGTVEFYSVDTIMNATREEFKSSDVDKYTVVIWIEGDDADTTDDKIGGSIKLKMDFAVQ